LLLLWKGRISCHDGCHIGYEDFAFPKTFTLFCHISGQTPQIRLSGNGKIFSAFFYPVTIIITIITYILGSMLVRACLKFIIVSTETHLLKHNTVERLEMKVITSTTILFITLWLAMSALFNIFNSTSTGYDEACFQTLSEILTIGHDSDIFGQPWTNINKQSMCYAFYIIMYYVEMSVVTLLVKMLLTNVISRGSGLCCIARLYKAREKYSVTCPKCVMVEKELNFIRQMRDLRQTAT